MSISRRTLVASTLAAPLLSAANASRLKIIVTGGHPGDPECGCAGTIARYTALGHEVVLLYLNRGEGFCGGADLSRCGAIRTTEAENASKSLKARAIFNDQIDGQAIVDNARYTSFERLMNAEKPDIVFTQWPIDTHRDHRAMSALVLDAWLKGGKTFALYYYEVSEDTMMFSPSDYVDISDPAIESIRHAACYAHVSQDPSKWYAGQTAITRFRGSESGHLQAESFLKHWQSTRGILP